VASKTAALHDVSQDYSEVSAFWRAGGDKGDLHAEDADEARAAISAFERDYGAKFSKAATKIVDDADMLRRSTTTRRSIGSTCA
jgi:hypothetical protein